MPRQPNRKEAALLDALTKAQAANDKLRALPKKADRSNAQNTQAARHSEALALQCFRALRLLIGQDTAQDVNDTTEE